MATLFDLTLALLLVATPQGAGAAEPASSGPSIASALETIASGQDDGSAAKSLVARGRSGLWALVDAVKTKTGAERGRLFEAVGRFATPESEWALIMELRHAAPATKVGVLRGLAHNHNPKLYPVLVSALDSAEPGVSEGAVDALASLGDRARDVLTTLSASPAPKSRAFAVRIAAKSQSRRLIDPLLPAALADPAPEVQREAIQLAVQVKDETQAKAIAHLARSKESAVAVAAVEALERLRGPTGAYELAAIASDPPVIEPAWYRAGQLLRGFGINGVHAYFDALERAGAERRPMLIGLIAPSATPAELEEVVQLLGSPSAVRAHLGEEVLDSAGEHGVEAAFLSLCAAPATLRRAIVTYFRARPDTGLSTRLVERAAQGPDGERLQSIQLLRELDEPTALARLVDLLADPSPEVRAEVAVAVARVPGCGVHERLLALTKDPSPLARAGALRALARASRGLLETDAAALQALADEDAAVRVAAIALLTKPSDVRIVRALRTHTMSAPPAERAAVAEALTDTKLVDAVKLLVDLSTDHDPTVREAAIRALGVRSPERGVPVFGAAS